MVAFLGDHLVFDISALTEKLSAMHVPGIGGFDLGGHHNALKLSHAGVLNLGKQDIFLHDGKQQLMVSGKEGDSVNLKTSEVAGLDMATGSITEPLRWAA